MVDLMSRVVFAVCKEQPLHEVEAVASCFDDICVTMEILNCFEVLRLAICVCEADLSDSM